MHALAAIISQPLDIAHSVVAILIGVAGGALLAELRLKPLARAVAIARRPKPTDPTDHGGPWG